jgi:hypothetical protein
MGRAGLPTWYDALLVAFSIVMNTQVMTKQCPDCKTVSADHVPYCDACGYQFAPVYLLGWIRARMTRERETLLSKYRAGAIWVGLGVAVARYLWVR